MTGPIAEWLEGQADRVFSRQRARVETSKVLAIFVAGIAATLVATSLQVGPPSLLDLAAVVALGCCIIATGAVVQADRLSEADHEAILLQGAAAGWTPDQTLQRLRGETIGAMAVNDQVVSRIAKVLIVQVILAALSSGVAAVALLIPKLVS